MKDQVLKETAPKTPKVPSANPIAKRKELETKATVKTLNTSVSNSMNSSSAEIRHVGLKKNPRMKIENMKKTATKLYERSASRSTESVRLVNKKPLRKVVVRRTEKKPRMMNSSLLYVGGLETLKKYLLEQEPQRMEIAIEYFEVAPDVAYILRSNLEEDRLLRHLRALLEPEA